MINEIETNWKRKMLWILGILIVATLILIIYFLVSMKGEGSNVNSATSRPEYDWCAPGNILVLDGEGDEGLIELLGEMDFSVLGGLVYQGLEVCHVRAEVSRQEYYFTENREIIFKLERAENGPLTNIVLIK